METLLTSRGKTYRLSEGGFLDDPGQWDEDFAVALADELKIPGGLTRKHWDVIHFIRETYKREGVCPLVFQTCRANKLHLKDLQALFPAGYLRGACRLAGITYVEGCFAPGLVQMGDQPVKVGASTSPARQRTYTIDAQGFLVDPGGWDEQYASLRAYEMGMQDGLTALHWKVIHFIRDGFKKRGIVPTVYETCEANGLELDDLEELFPHGYHRGAVKLAGLRVR